VGLAAINLVAALLSIPVIAAGIWLSAQVDSACVQLLQWPLIGLGVAVLAVGLAGFVAASWRLPWLLLADLVGMLLLVVSSSSPAARRRVVTPCPAGPSSSTSSTISRAAGYAAAWTSLQADGSRSRRAWPPRPSAPTSTRHTPRRRISSPPPGSPRCSPGAASLPPGVATPSSPRSRGLAPSAPPPTRIAAPGATTLLSSVSSCFSCNHGGGEFFKHGKNSFLLLLFPFLLFPLPPASSRLPPLWPLAERQLALLTAQVGSPNRHCRLLKPPASPSPFLSAPRASSLKRRSLTLELPPCRLSTVATIDNHDSRARAREREVTSAASRIWRSSVPAALLLSPAGATRAPPLLSSSSRWPPPLLLSRGTHVGPACQVVRPRRWLPGGGASSPASSSPSCGRRWRRAAAAIITEIDSTPLPSSRCRR